MTDCGITNLGSCIVEKFFEYIVYILNLPVKPLLGKIDNFLTTPVPVDMFVDVWAIIIYILSLFYGILLLIVGFRFIISGYSPEQRDKAKRSLANIIIMMILVQASFLLYELILEVVASMTAVVFNLIPSDFFLLTADNFENLGLEILLLIPYVAVLIITVIFLSMRYIFVGVGVVLFAIAIFLYFVEPFNAYGRIFLNYLGLAIALPFIYSIILLASSKFLTVDAFVDFKILLMIGGFLLADVITLLLTLSVIFRTTNSISTPIKQIQTISSAIS